MPSAVLSSRQFGRYFGRSFPCRPRFASASLPPSLTPAFTRKEDRDKPNGQEVKEAQYDAVVEWGIPDGSKLDRLAGTRQPTLVTNGDNDAMIPTINTHIFGEHLPRARVRIFPDAGHGFLFQWPVKFANVVGTFLAA
jgi:pimeloyl-ACP methyl ester carboxylesterase